MEDYVEFSNEGANEESTDDPVTNFQDDEVTLNSTNDEEYHARDSALPKYDCIENIPRPVPPRPPPPQQHTSEPRIQSLQSESATIEHTDGIVTENEQRPISVVALYQPITLQPQPVDIQQTSRFGGSGAYSHYGEYFSRQTRPWSSGLFNCGMDCKSCKSLKYTSQVHPMKNYVISEH